MTKADKEGRRKAPILRFKGFTDDWEQRELGQLMEIGSVKRIHMNEWKNTGVPFFRARDIVAKFNNKKISDPIYISEETYNSNILKSGKVKKGQLLITGVGTIGIPYLITDDSPLYFKDGNVIWLKNNNYDGNFIFYFFTTNLFKNYLFKITGTGTVGTYTIENAKKTPISTPQINEQIKIGKLFNILENLLALYEKKKQLLTQLKQGIVNFLITKNGQKPQLRFSGFNNNWESKSFEKLLNYEQPTKYIVKKADYISQGTSVLTANKSFVLGYTNETNVYQNIPAIIFDDFTLESKYVDFPFMVKSSAIKILTSKNSNLFFIYQLLNNQRFVQEGHSRHYISVVQKKKVLVPSIQEQNKISDLIKQLEDNIELNSNTIVLLKKLKEFLLQNMFL